MTRFERITLIISSLALVVSLLVAALGPWVTYYWFDPTSKAFSERAIFVTVHSDIIPPLVDDSPINGAPRLVAHIQLQNIGHYPANNAKIIVVANEASATEPEISVWGRVTERNKTSGRVSEYSFSQAVAPNGTIDLSASGAIAGLYFITEHGDKTVLYEPGSGSGSSSW